MEPIKVEDLPSHAEEFNCDNFCFICLQQVDQINEEQFNSLNFFFNFLKVSEIKEAFVCETCGEKLAKFVKLCRTLEKVRLEMDYLLGFIQLEISNSNGNFERAVGVTLDRECVVRKCAENIYYPQPKLFLKRVGVSKFLKSQGQTAASDCSDDWSPNWDADHGQPSSSNDSDEPNDESFPVQDKGLNSNGKTTRAKCPKCFKTFCRERYLKIHNAIVHLRLKPFKCSKCHKSFSFRSDLRRHMDTIHIHPKSYRSKPRSLCPKCPRTFSCEKRLTHHLNTVHLRPRLNTFKCTKCSKTFKAKRNLKIHNDAVHLHLRPFKCSTCSKSFSTETYLRLHTNVVHLHLKPYKCDICGKSFASQSYFRVHKATPHKPKPPIPNGTKVIPCDICGKSYDKLTLKHHIRVVHNEKRFPCGFCKKIFKTQSVLNKHVSSLHEMQRHKCQAPGCDRNYALRSGLVNHYKLEHPDFLASQIALTRVDYTEKLENGESVLECNLCGKKLKSLRTVRDHIKRAHAPKTFSCPDCGFTTSSNHNLTNHIKRFHKIEMVQCEFCSKQMKSLDLTNHISLAHGEKKFICQFCGYAATADYILQGHIKRRHNNKSEERDETKRVYCQVPGCGKNYFSRRVLVGHHKLKHPDLPVPSPGPRKRRPRLPTTKAENVCCEECGKTFTNIYRLKRHRLSHEENGFPCDTCGKILKSRQLLKLHISSIHDKQRYYCQVEGCDKNYSHQSRLYGHYKTDHPEFTLPPKPSKYADNFTLVIENGQSVMECKLCQRKFETLQPFLQHMRVAHGPKRFKCQDCNYETYHKILFENHVKRVHKDQVKVEMEDGESTQNN